MITDHYGGHMEEIQSERRQVEELQPERRQVEELQSERTQIEKIRPEPRQPEEAQSTKGLRLEVRVDEEQNQRLEKLSNYAAIEGISPSDYRGNKTAWVNYCLMVGEQLLRQHAYQKRGF